MNKAARTPKASANPTTAPAFNDQALIGSPASSEAVASFRHSPTEVLLQDRAKLFELERLGQVVVGVEFSKRFGPVTRRRVDRGHDDHLQPGSGGIALQAPAHFPPLPSRHESVGPDEIRLVLARQIHNPPAPPAGGSALAQPCPR